MTQQFSLFDTIQSHVEDFESQLYTGMPAIVESYNPEDCTVDCYPAIYAIEKDGVVQKEQILEAVPVIFPSASDVAITFPIKKGDSVWLQFSMRDMTRWLEGDEEYSVPPTMRKHNMNDAVAFAGIHKYSKSPVKDSESVNIYYKDSFISIKPDGHIDINVNDTFSVTNSSGELIDWLSQLLGILESTTVNTVYGVSPLNTKAQITSLKSLLDTMKKGG